MPNIAIPVKLYPSSKLRGPPCVWARPIPKNKPVPMVPPRAMNWICRDFSLFPLVSSTPCYRRHSIGKGNRTRARHIHILRLFQGLRIFPQPHRTELPYVYLLFMIIIWRCFHIVCGRLVHCWLLPRDALYVNWLNDGKHKSDHTGPTNCQEETDSPSRIESGKSLKDSNFWFLWTLLINFSVTLQKAL